ncbi:MAG: hypothetical protein KA007_00110 [Candidatus Pacebacteria bacterium]|jgi:hypothetical protein|nr:hypothetical protein [Candidatus Paceibacterota bacterium]
MSDLFSTPISTTKVRNGVNAYKYSNGVININGSKYLMMSVTDAVKIWRRNNPITGYDRWLNSLGKN